VFTMTKEYINSFAKHTHDDICDYQDMPTKAVKHENGKWYAIWPKRNGMMVRNENNNYFALAEITPDAKYIAPVGKAVLNDDTIVEIKDLHEFRNFRMKDRRQIFVSVDEEGWFRFTKDHIIYTMYPECK